MAREDKYGLASLRRDFGTEEACLEFIFDARHSRECSCGGTYSKVAGRRQYQCSRCRFQIAPTAGTIFHKSTTPLTLWFHAIWVFSNAKSGISAKEMERQIEVTYKTAWRMLRLIREALRNDESPRKLKGVVEMDGAYIGGRVKGKDKYGNKSPVLAVIERGGEARASSVPDHKADTQGAFLQKHVDHKESILMTDSTKTLYNAAKGYERHMVDHSRLEYSRGTVHVNTVESFWSHLKRSVKGTHKSVSTQHLQGYLDAFAFHWSNSRSDTQRFSVLLGTVLLSTT